MQTLSIHKKRKLKIILYDPLKCILIVLEGVCDWIPIGINWAQNKGLDNTGHLPTL